MGLDVYLYRYENVAELEKEREYESKTNALWEQKYGPLYKAASIDEARSSITLEYEAAKREIAKALELDEDGEGRAAAERIEQDSAKHPDHICKVGYLRSSYNSAGYNSVARDVLGSGGFYEIFQPENEAYKVQPDWKAARERAAAQLEKWKQAQQDGGFTVIEVDSTMAMARLVQQQGGEVALSPLARVLREAASGNQKRKLPDDPGPVRHSFGALQLFREQRALQLFREEQWQKENPDGDLDSDSAPFGNYSNRDGHFFLKKPLHVHALIEGVYEEGRFKSGPVVFAVCEREGGYEHQMQACEIVIEMCDYVLGHSEEEHANFVLHWSA